MEDKPFAGRRRFLIAAGTAAVVGTTGILGGTRNANAGQGTLATLIDLTRCDGCPGKEVPACVAACKRIKQGSLPEPSHPIPVPFPTRRVEDWSHRREEFNRLTPYNLIYIQKAEIVSGGRKQTLFIPRRCMHCDNPACATLCPFSANHKFANGAVVIDSETCFGGAKCKTVCPWEIPQRQSGIGIYLKVLPTLMGNGIMVKCDLCSALLAKRQEPACIGACPRQAMAIGGRKEISTQAESRARQIGGFLYGNTENGGTSTRYISPVPFEILNAALKPGPGQPGLGPVQRRMAGTDNLGKVVLASPALGIAAGVAGAFVFMSRRKNGSGKGE